MSTHRFVRHKRFKWKSAPFSSEFDEFVVEQRFVARDEEFVEIKNLKSGLKKTVAHDELLAQFFKGFIEFEIKGDIGKSGEGESFSTEYMTEAPDDVDQNDWNIALLRLKAILPLLSIRRTKESYGKRLDVIKKAVEESEHSDVSQIYDRAISEIDIFSQEWTREEFDFLRIRSARSLQRFVSKFIKSDGNVRSLLTNHKNSGAPGVTRINTDAQIYAAIDNVSPYASAREVLGEAGLLIDEINDANGTEEILIAPSLRTVQRRVSEIQYKRRMDQYLGSVRSTIDSKQHGVFEELTYPYQRIEVDGTRTDLIVVNDEGEPIGRLTFIVAIDVKTRVIAGYYLGFEPESWQSVSDTLFDVIRCNESPITRWGTTGEIKNLYGIPYALTHDRGKGFKNRHMIDSMSALGSIILTAGVLHGEGKAFIESFLNTINKSFWHVKLGSTLSSYLDLGKHDPKKVACVYLSDIDSKFNKYRFDLYHMDGHSGLNGATPHDTYHEFVDKGWEPRLPQSARNLGILLGRTDYKQLTDKGIFHRYIRYNNRYSNELVEFRKKVSYLQKHAGEGPVRTDLIGRELPPDRVKIKIISTDINMIYMHNYLNDTYIPMFSHHPEYTQGLPIWKHQIIRKMITRQNSGVTDKNLAHTRRELRQEFESQAPGVQKARFESDGRASRNFAHRNLSDESTKPETDDSSAARDKSLSEDELADIFAQSRLQASEWIDNQDSIK